MKAIYRPNLYLGSVEKNRIQEIERKATLDLFNNLIKTYGLIITKTGKTSLEADWLVTKTGDNLVKVNAGSALLKVNDFPNLFSIEDTTLNIPSTNGTYKILISGEENSFEQGTVTLTNSSNIVTGSGTEFTKIFAVNRKIIINNVAYNILGVTNDTQIIIQNVYSGSTTSNLQFKCGGYFVDEPSSIDDKLIYEYNKCNLIVTTSAKGSNEFWIAEVVVAGGVISTITDKRSLNLLEYFLNVPSIDGTVSESFMVGGKYVQLEPIMPEAPLNLRIYDVSGEGAKTSKLNDKLNVKLKIGWDNITGTGGLNTFAITSGQTFVEDSLVGHYLWIPQISKNLKITNNEIDILYVTEEGGGNWDGTGINVTSLPAWIHPNAEVYDIVAIDQTDPTIRVKDRFFYAESPTKIDFTLQLTIGRTYLIKARSGRSNVYSNYSVMASGTYDKYETTVSYANPYLVVHPNIPTPGNVTLLQTRNGFQVIINGWTEAENFEVVYTTKNSGASFGDPEQDKIITNKTVVSIPTNSSAIYNVGVRPLIAMQQVRTPIYGNVKSGSAGQLPRDIVIPINVNLKTYSGTITYNDIAGLFELTNIVNPASGTLSVTGLNDLEGCILTDSTGKDYLISTIYGILVELENLSGNSYPLNASLNGSFTINVSKRGRMVFKSNSYPSDYEISRIDFDCDVKKGEDVTIRVYQEGKETSAATLLVTQSDTQQYTDCSVLVSYVNGARNIIVDLFDPAVSGAKNKGSLTGLLTLYLSPQTDAVQSPL